MVGAKVKANYNLMDIINSGEFFERLAGAAKISKTNFEASFCIYGDGKRYKITKVLKEERDRCLTGKDYQDGFVFDKKGHGLWCPESKNKIVNVHFHPSYSLAVPSFADLESDDYKNMLKIDKKGKCFSFNVTNVVGHSENEKITLLFRQLINDFPLESFESLTEYVEGLKKSLLENKRGELDFSDKTLPYKMADILNSTKKYRAAVVAFKNMKEYKKEIQKLKGFSLFLKHQCDEKHDYDYNAGLTKANLLEDELFDENEEIERVERELEIPAYSKSEEEGFSIIRP